MFLSSNSDQQGGSAKAEKFSVFDALGAEPMSATNKKLNR
jgi:hypothetical protein